MPAMFTVCISLRNRLLIPLFPYDIDWQNWGIFFKFFVNTRHFVALLNQMLYYGQAFGNIQK